MKTSSKLIPILAMFSLAVLFLDCSHATLSYPGRENGAEWRRKALERIEKIRKSNLSIEVVDGNGMPLPGAQVKVEMQKHAFAFGSAVNARNLVSPSSDGQRYRALVEKNFNKVVFENDLKWGPWDASRNSPGDVDNALAWLNQRDIAVRGHCAVWAHLEGDAGTVRRKTLPPQEFRAAVMKHAEDVVRTVGPRVTEWDVVNHPIGWGKGTMGELFGPTFYDNVFEQVALWNPQVKRHINEGDVLTHDGKDRDKYFRLLSDMRARGAKVEGVGFMGHFRADRNLAPPDELLATYDRFAKLGLPLQVTEFDVRFGNEMEKPFALTADQEALQADYMRDFLIASFSHPSLQGVVMWGFWEGRDWYPDAALYRLNWSVKPNGKVWEDLVLHQWWTKVSGASGNDGRFSTRGFTGDYLVTVSSAGKSAVVKHVKLGPAGSALKVVVKWN